MIRSSKIPAQTERIFTTSVKNISYFYQKRIVKFRRCLNPNWNFTIILETKFILIWMAVDLFDRLQIPFLKFPRTSVQLSNRKEMLNYFFNFSSPPYCIHLLVFLSRPLILFEMLLPKKTYELGKLLKLLKRLEQRNLLGWNSWKWIKKLCSQSDLNTNPFAASLSQWWDISKLSKPTHS